jgi:hypothetical protein
MSKNTRRNKRIKEIAKEIEQLSEELNALLMSEEASNTINERESFINNDNNIELGNVVEITNNYKNLQGTRGTVIKVTKHQVTIKLEDNNEVIKRKKSNVRKI